MFRTRGGTIKGDMIRYYELHLAASSSGGLRLGHRRTGRADSRAQTTALATRHLRADLPLRTETDPSSAFSLVRAPHSTRLGDYHTRHVPPGSPTAPQPTRLRSAETADAPPPDSTAAHHHQPSGEPMAHADRMHSWARHAHTSLKVPVWTPCQGPRVRSVVVWPEAIITYAKWGDTLGP